MFCSFDRPQTGQLGPRLADNPYIYWGSVYAATCVTVGALTAATSEIVRLLWRTDPFSR